LRVTLLGAEFRADIFGPRKRGNKAAAVPFEKRKEFPA
jgi:hypothetical protein